MTLSEHERADLERIHAQAIWQRAQAANLLIQAGWDDVAVANVVGLPGLIVGASAAS